MFTSIVVSLDLDDTGDRALPAAAWLAKLSGLPVELITVSSPGMPTAIDTYELERRAKMYRLDRFSCLVLHDDDAGAAIIEHMAARPRALLVMGTSAKGPVARHFLGSVSEYVLGRICSPALVAGPRTTTRCSASPTLIACVGDSDRVDVLVPAIASWVGTFGGRTVLTTVESTGDDTAAALASDRLGQLAGQVAAACGSTTTPVVLHDRDAATALDEFARGITDAVLLAVSARWTDTHVHRHSVTRNLVRHSTAPVLVVPATRMAPTRRLDPVC